MSTEFPDVEGAVRSYLRAHADVVAVASNRGYFAVPTNPTWPLYVVTEVGTFEAESDAPVDDVTIRIDCWGDVHAGTENHPKKGQARALRDAVRQALHDLHHHPVDIDLAATSDRAAQTVRLDGARVQSALYVPDPTDSRPRYAITASVTARKLVTIP